ncbi:hypothetical protein KQI11_10075 [Acetanaerobacterium sp. MSJ-12]|uniref:hypothetical protein n=2 Tax=Oscillospiraceae TaxID=216572 RepID=UPI001C0EF972|nr:hypothetical protein [Acetanaerobacterium sp. MSJ-12]MBU5420469.1 hypothetical protein [Acetanaerobacterium sp. MSJ-12]
MNIDSVDFQSFQVVQPNASRYSSLSVSAMADGTLRLNSKTILYAFSNDKNHFVRVLFSAKQRLICLEFLPDNDGSASKTPRGGTVSIRALKDVLEQAQISLPAFFPLKEAGEGRLVGECDPNHHFLPQSPVSKRVRKARKTDLAAMLSVGNSQ